MKFFYQMYFPIQAKNILFTLFSVMRGKYWIGLRYFQNVVFQNFADKMISKLFQCEMRNILLHR